MIQDFLSLFKYRDDSSIISIFTLPYLTIRTMSSSVIPPLPRRKERKTSPPPLNADSSKLNTFSIDRTLHLAFQP